MLKGMCPGGHSQLLDKKEWLSEKQMTKLLKEGEQLFLGFIHNLEKHF